MWNTSGLINAHVEGVAVGSAPLRVTVDARAAPYHTERPGPAMPPPPPAPAPMPRPPRLKLAALLTGLALVGGAAAVTATPSSAQVVAPHVDADLDVTQASVRQAQADVAAEL